MEKKKIKRVGNVFEQNASDNLLGEKTNNIMRLVKHCSFNHNIKVL